jgi:carbonic anhydrase
LHIDFKLPAEHQIYGNKFDAEMQVFHIHPGRRLLPAISVLFKVGDYNPIMDQVIDAFQYKFDVDAAKCGENRRRGRQLVSDFYSTVMEGKEGNVGTESYYKGWGEFSTKMDDPNFAREEQEQERKLAEKWHPYHPDIMKSIYFYGYDGSLTEPPCTEIVSWFVMDTPATISQGQLDRLKNILFNHVDKDCQRTSTHYQKRGVARPPQDRNGRMVWHCNANHFTPDN